MAYADITLNDGASTPVAHVYTAINQKNGRVLRSDFAAAAETPWTLTMGHNEQTRAGSKVKSHLIRFDITVLDADGITPRTANARICADVPIAIQSDQLADHFAALVRNYATSANFRAFFKDSVG